MAELAQQISKPKQQSKQKKEFEKQIETEWLLTNNRGSFAAGTICGCNTRRYHGLLTGTLVPPAKRTVALANCLETVITENKRYNLNHFEFEPPSPENAPPLPTGFRKDIGVHFDYSGSLFNLTKSIYLLPETDITAIVYDFSDIQQKFDFTVRPLAAMRNYHSLARAGENFYLEWQDDFLAVKNKNFEQAQLLLATDEMAFMEDTQWWYNFSYRQEKSRGYDYMEDLWSPGIFRRTIDGPVRIVLWAGFGDADMPHKMAGLDVDVIIDDLKLQQKQVLGNMKNKDPLVQSLAVSAEQFIINRHLEKLKTKSIMAGFPWFVDWGRDALISLEGLLLCCGRYEDAFSVLMNFAYNADEGMIANYFGDDESGAHYNSIDTSLWFVHAAFKYYKVSGDSRGFTSRLMPVVRWVVDSYWQGTKFGIKADTDGLITGGSYETQLTWMDAKFDNVAFTPRYGKAVEINALWYNAICNCAEFYRNRDAVLAERFGKMADKLVGSFRSCFWNQQGQYLYDCVTTEYKDASIRPNQIFAVSLPFSPLDCQQQKAVVSCVENNLLTPFGLRTLNQGDSKYKGKYEGGPKERDSAYHQGTVWPWLIGAFVEAYLKVNNNNKQSKKTCADWIEPLIEHFRNEGCVGSINEIFDGDPPYEPRGAFAQAWSVAEVLRACMMING
ncbi:MAG: amylo-alpha-1,6-glucosidase [Phycisphaerae bacterium]|jgi:predicted glycogen debranching enzyme